MPEAKTIKLDTNQEFQMLMSEKVNTAELKIFCKFQRSISKNESDKRPLKEKIQDFFKTQYCLLRKKSESLNIKIKFEGFIKFNTTSILIMFDSFKKPEPEFPSQTSLKAINFNELLSGNINVSPTFQGYQSQNKLQELAKEIFNEFISDLSSTFAIDLNNAEKPTQCLSSQLVFANSAVQENEKEIEDRLANLGLD